MSGHLESQSPPSSATQSISDKVSDKDNSRTHILDNPDAEATIKRAVRKMDLTIMPLMTLFYLLSFLDRANIGNAKVAGLNQDLGLTDHQYSLAVTITYVPYVLSEIPSNLVLRKVGASLAMPTIMTVWGLIVVFQGFVTSFAGLATARAFLGLVEGPLFPGIVLYLSSFYTREELSFRIAFFFSAASLSGAFSGLLAAAISKLDGVGNKPAWAWIFILEGLFTVVCGLASFFLVPLTPRHSKALSLYEKDMVMARLERDRPFVNPLDHFSFKYVLQAIKSPHVLLIIVIYFMGGTNLFGLALFLPTIVKELGHSANRSQLLSVGPFAVGFVVTVFVAWTSDRYKVRFIPLCAVSILAIVGYLMFLVSDDKTINYAALFLMVPGIYATTPVTAAWLSNNSEPHYTRATAIAVGFMATNCGGILSTWRYPKTDAPRYRSTTIMNLVFTIGVIVLALVNAAYLKFRTRQKLRNRDQILAPYITDKEPNGGLEAWLNLGDRHPDFKYIL
ncbi:hypothetical protein D9619_009310 [Psilocybe cf. subviscida]|uniref:Major facilitator superfamily (MFS) profile domain-containing protein n=1 Tax=Psilocybe cf. subviscida TaxID=2480587 RepID=A0A8H5FA92_9AGAR|nr:hypothetical protein D9619_009310 [Psilocybe cf. subviscida]